MNTFPRILTSEHWKPSHFLAPSHSPSASRVVAFFVTLATACVWRAATAFHELRGSYYDSVGLPAGLRNGD
ncbi:MAG TPA: hypothetical protein VHW24_16105 [Bryobacteraceae bacterium]|nr:hypothetical protein [Bryobacteraceae bacterium]